MPNTEVILASNPLTPAKEPKENLKRLVKPTAIEDDGKQTKETKETASYSPETMWAIIAASKIAGGLEKPFKTLTVKTSEGNTMEVGIVYVYPFQLLTPSSFLIDTIAYFLAETGDLQPRNVCFLFLDNSQKPKPQAFIVQLSEPNQKLTAELRQALEGKSDLAEPELERKRKFEAIQARPELLQNCKRLYGKTKFILMGDEHFIEELTKPLATAYQGESELACMSLPNAHRNVILTECILSMLQFGETKEVAPPTVIKDHHGALALGFCEALDELAHANDPNFSDIEKELIRLFKFAELKQRREALDRLAPHTVEDIEALLNTDKISKRAIYQRKIQINEYIKCLSVEFLTKLWFIRKQSNNLLTLLKTIGNREASQLKAWESTWEKRFKVLKATESRTSKLVRWTKKVTSTAYQHSLIPLGAHLLNWMGAGLVSSLKKSKKMKALVTFLKEFAELTVKWTVFFATFSPRLAHASSKATARILREENLPILFKSLGGGIGLSLTLLGGARFFVRLLGIQLVGNQMKKFLHTNTLNDQNASFTRVETVHRQTINQAVFVSAALLESVYIHNPFAFFAAVGGAIGSYTTTTLAQAWDPDLQDERDLNEDQTYILLFLSTGGFIVGYELTNIGMNYGINVSLKRKVEAREKVLNTLKTWQMPNNASLDVSFPDLKPLDVLTGENPVRLTFQFPNGLTITQDCQIKTSENLTYCGEANFSQQFRLATS